MSVTTILESYDTQMDYSGDFDVAMQTAASSSDTWPYHIMDQDAHHGSQSTGAADRESVEVDMEETYPDHPDHESVEYEMVDEEEIYPHEGGDLLDVEVYDASRLQSPAPMPATIDIPQMTSEEIVDFTIQTTPAFTDPHNSVATSTVLQEPDLHEHSTDDLLPVGTIPDSSRRFGVREEPPDQVVAFGPGHPEHLVDASADEQTIHDHTIPMSKTETTGEVTESSNSAATDVGETAHAHNRPTESAPTWPHPQDQKPAAHSHPLPESEHLGSEDYSGEVQHYHSNETTADTADPHEISEGVYIDPPPAVLLTIQSSDQPEICLFNQPPTHTGSLSPSEGTHNPGQHVLTLLLHHRPTLYYEPLTNVFDALRQEEHITGMLELAEGELALDAYDLQLLVSEDNAHAREVTLHDLNVLHDGSDLSGPLRLRLHVIVPRFIIRYHILRDQIARLNLVAEGGEEDEHGTTHSEHYDPNAEDYHDLEEYRQADAQPEEQDEEYQGQQLNQQSNEQSADHPDLPPSNLTDEQAAGDISNLTTEDHDYVQNHGEEAQASGDNEYADANAVANNDPEDSAAAGDPEATDYENYTEAVEYDERYSEVLPEHESAVDSNKTLYPEDTDDQKVADVDNVQEALLEPDIVATTPAVDPVELTDELPAGDDDNTPKGGGEGVHQETNRNNVEVVSHDDRDHIFLGVPGADELDSNFAAVSEQEADLTDPDVESTASPSEPQKPQEPELQYPELDDDHEWDDDLDAEGEIDSTWLVDHDDDVSNQSSTTLSSTTSIAKRGYDELDENELGGDGHSTQKSPHDSKRLRVL